MSWNHRVLAHTDKDEIYYQIHEVYYDQDGKPDGYTADAIGIGGETLEEISLTLDRMKECIGKPIISAENFPNEL